MKENIVIIDGSSLLYRAFFAIPHLSDPQGRPTNAVYGFLNMLLKLYSELNPQYVAVAFDKGKYTFRNDLYDGYKATRKEAPDDLRPQFALIREVLDCLGISVLEQEGYEGDDIIGTLAKNMAAEGYAVDVVTGDRDALQLVTNDVTVYLTKKGITQMLAVTPAVMEEEYGYTPAQVIEMKALMGDTADNIPGVPGVGEKTALKLISQFGSVTGVYEHLADVKGKKLQEKLADNKDKALLSKDLATIRCDLDLTYTIDQFQPQPRQADVAELFKSLGFRNLLERFAAFDRFAHLESGADAAAAPVVEAIEAPLADSLKDQIVAVAAEFDDHQPIPALTGLSMATEKGAFTVPPEGYGDYLSVLPQAKAVITADGKNLTKAVSAVASGRLPLKDIILAAYLLDPTRTSYGLTYISETFDVNLQEPADDEAKRLVSDAAFALSVWPKVEEKMGEASLTDLYASIEEPLVRTLAVMEMNGLPSIRSGSWP